MRPVNFTLLLIFVLMASVMPAFSANARVWQEDLPIPTYQLGAEDPNPPFPLAGRGGVYPYAMLDDLTDRLETKTYKAVFLENEYLKAIVLPEMGGHLYSLYDKLNKREVLYRNHVVKYGLVALRGAWVSGGVEFDFPNGHTVVTVSPVAFTTSQGPDGSGTVVVGDVDQVTGMHWEVALTLRPGKARLEQQVTLFNATPLTNLYWFWANAAVPATEDMKFIYPMREANPHEKGMLWSYPVHEGVDYSQSKNVRQPTSLFAYHVHRNFFGAYYAKSDCGVVHVADFREVPGKKVWTWGMAGDGAIWTDLLTDHDGPYNEIQAGRYETQLSYEFIPPRKAESFTEFWYPVAGLQGGFVEATPLLALNVNFLEARQGNPQHVEFFLSPTAPIHGAMVRVKLGTQVLKDFGPLSFEPLTTIKVGVPVADLNAAKSKIEIAVSAPNGLNLLEWSAADPIDGNPDLVLAAGASPLLPPPTEKISVEELFLRGVEQEKEGRQRAAAETYRAVLERDTGYAPALVKMAWQQFEGGDFHTAETFITRALVRNGLDPTALYAAGVIYRAEHRWSMAQDAFWGVIHYGGPEAPAYAQLGEIALRLQNYVQATTLLYQALSHNPYDALAVTDLAVSMRLAGRAAEAGKMIGQALERMPLLPYARAEQWIIQTSLEKAAPKPAGNVPKDWAVPYPPTADTYLEVAAWYRTLGDLAASNAVLQSALVRLPASAITPVVYYYLAANAREAGKDDQADEFARQGQAAPYTMVFPNRLEDASVIDDELRDHPLDTHAAYFVGNYLFAHDRFDEAARYWLEAFGQGFEYSVLLRNLGLYAWRVKKDLAGAAGFYENAVKLAPEDYRLYTDLDEIYFRMGKAGSREKLFAAAPASVLDRDSVRVRRALLLTQEREYDKAVQLLKDHHFKPWEGGVGVREIYVLTYLQKGRSALDDGKPLDAVLAFREALEYPPSLGVGKPDKPHDEETLFWLGEALKALDNTDAARAAWTQAAEEGQHASEVATLYRGMALRRLGEVQEADKVLRTLSEVKPGDKPSAAEWYAAGLLDLFDNRSDKAAAKFTAALEADPAYWPARLALDRVAR
jgi:tetratricopeptide (TPR) repeat protein